ncbi:MAG: hypothetical protein J4G05_02720 [Chlorobi bacterium]|nr:hypothetical protein [Chlorobiota bacterium]
MEREAKEPMKEPEVLSQERGILLRVFRLLKKQVWKTCGIRGFVGSWEQIIGRRSSLIRTGVRDTREKSPVVWELAERSLERLPRQL